MSKQTPRSFLDKDAAEWEHDGWTSCPNSILRHPELPWELRAVWAWLASHTATFEITAEKLRQAGPKGRDWAYNAIKELERWGLLTRHHEIAENGQPIIRYKLHHQPVPEDRRTYEAPKAVSRSRQHPGSKARTPDGSGIRSELGVPDGPGAESTPDGPVSDGSGVPYKEENTREKTNQPPVIREGDSPERGDDGWLDEPPTEQPARPSPGVRFLTHLPDVCRPNWHAIQRLAPRVEALLAGELTEDALQRRLTAGIDSAVNPPGAVIRRLEDLALPKGVAAPPRPAWCGDPDCDERTRQRENAQGLPFRCPRCHPKAVVVDAPAS